MVRVIGLGLKNSDKRGYTELCYVDDQDYELVSKYSWNNDGRGYARTSFRQKNKIFSFKLHRLILGITDPKIQVDHIDRNPLNNTRANLRLCDNSENQRNSGPQSNSKSAIRGVSWNKTNKYWACHIRHNGEKRLLMSTKDPELASKTYAYFERLIGGEFHSNHPYYDSEFITTQLTPKGWELLEILNTK